MSLYPITTSLVIHYPPIKRALPWTEEQDTASEKPLTEDEKKLIDTFLAEDLQSVPLGQKALSAKRVKTTALTERRIEVSCIEYSNLHVPLNFCSLEQASQQRFINFREMVRIYALALVEFSKFKNHWGNLKYANNISPFDPQKILIDFSEMRKLRVTLIFAQLTKEEAKKFFEKNQIDYKSKTWSNYGPAHRIRNFILELSNHHLPTGDLFFYNVTCTLATYNHSSKLTCYQLKQLLERLESTYITL